jgi:YHS domain-containing protein
MSGERPSAVIDPVCGMTVDVATAEAGGLTLEHEGRTYAFCRSGCRRAFLEEPAVYAERASAAAAAVAAGTPGERVLPVIDEGMRRWYESCSCCLGDAYPEIKAQLDAERVTADQGIVGAGICEVAEAG